MKTWVALFRGINVGGNNILPMADLRSDLEALKLKNVRTYIQSGNVVFEAGIRSAGPLQKKMSDLIEKRHGFRPNVVILNGQQLLDAIDANPFEQAAAEPKSVHFFFLSEPATDADIKAIKSAQAATEGFHLTDEVFYLLAPNGIGRSKLAANAERYLKVSTTARNFRTVDKLRTMIVE